MSKLFESARIKTMYLKNRIVKSALFESMATLDGLPTDKTLHFYERLARGGTGLIITGYAYVNKDGRSYPLQNGAHSDAIIERWRRVTEKVHEHGSRIALQIVHGGRQTKPVASDNRRRLAPSAIPNLVYFTWPKSMSEEEIWQTITDFADAAERAVKAGFDAIQIHAAHGYLISSFLSPVTNRRTDRWGGSIRGRFRFLEEVYKAVRLRVGNDFPVLAKLNIIDFVPLGLSPNNSFPAAMLLAELGLDALEISGGIAETSLGMSRGDSPAKVITRNRSPLLRLYFTLSLAGMKAVLPFRENYFLDYARRLKPALTIPLILVGGIRNPLAAEQILQAGHADFISMARPLVREPSLPNKWLKGSTRPATCTSCNRCLGEVEQGNILKCYLLKKTADPA
ncbi:MAG TPA: NADH:flavin oxidoreductase [Deltaproteobacteria bacterium]|nr:NADH:flavin oxidoreductase [Deltaproteobacteria bacterium]